MSDSDTSITDNYVSFLNVFKLKDLEQALTSYKGTDQYDAVLRYYTGCIASLDSPQMLEPLGLLKQALGALGGNGRKRRASGSQPPARPDEVPAGLANLYTRLEGFEARLHNSLEQLRQPATEVPKQLHFAWLGGGIGDIQHDYINLWKRVMAPQGHSLNLWYDSDALLAYETNRIIVEAAKADAMLNGGQGTDDAISLGDLYEERAIVLKQQMYAHITQAVGKGASADDARIDLLVRAYGQDEARLRTLKRDNTLSLKALAEDDLTLRDLAKGELPLRLDTLYRREICLRGNFAAASDIVRVEALFAEGGRYADVDNLPPLVDKLGEVDIRGFKTDARLGVLQLLLDRNPDWMPGRQALRSRYTDYFTEIPAQHRAALERFADSQPDLNRVFRPPVERLAHPNGLRAVAEQHTVSNAFLMAHPGSAVLDTVIERFRRNYEVVDAMSRLADEDNTGLTNVEGLMAHALKAAAQVFGSLREMPAEDELAVSLVAQAAATYYSDGIRPQSEGTIYLTGPAAMRSGMADYERAHFTPRTALEWQKDTRIEAVATVNRATEEELDHSWKENESDTHQWLANEKKRWQDGRFKARYAGDLKQLLRYRTLEFDHGWPLIEGRPVLSTALLQHLADELGEPFMNAMNQSHDGAVTFNKVIALSFDERQSIRTQEASVLLPASSSNSQTRQLSVDELLGRLAKDRFDLVQLSPLQRLQLGALVGAKALDNRSFDAVRPQLENLANSLVELGTAGRYAAIERLLYQHRAPSFLAGLAHAADAPGHSETALGLKKQALEQALTLRQWGQLAARIQQVAKLEYRDRIAERLGNVLDVFDAAVIKLVPQDLLLQGAGDRVGGRCYPLALTMAAALSEGPSAAYTLRGRFYLGVLEPEGSDSVTFLNSLELLRDVQVGDVGSALARASLDEVVGILRARTTTSTLMLNSDNHAMLVARTFDGGQSTYHFYDPNFGLFEFENSARFGQALNRFFVQQGMAGQYAAYGDGARPTFDLIELDGARVANVALPGAIRVAELLRPGGLPEQSKHPVRQRLASARGQSLMNNPRLGAALLALDGHGWAQQIAQVTSRLKQANQLAPGLVPLFDTLEVTPDGAYRMSFIDPSDAERLVRVITDDHRLLRIKNHLSECFSALANKPLVPGDPTEVGSVHTLNAGFAVQALMNALRHQEGAERPLTLAVRLHAYVSYAQLVHGNVVDIAGLVGLVRQALAEDKLIADTVAPVVKAAVGARVGEAAGGLLQLANVGFDIYQLATAQDDVTRAQFGTQLAFDSAGLVLSVGAYAAGATAGAVLGGAAVILGGLAVGVAALAQGFATIAEEARQVGLFFDEVEKAHLQAYRFNAAHRAWMPRASLIVQAVDLARGELRLDSPRLYPLRDHFGVPTFDADYARAINIRRELDLPERVRFTPPAGQTVVLPCTPETCYAYEYKALPFATLRHDTGFDVARRLEKKNAQGEWLFLFSFYSFPSEYILHRLTLPDYRPTVVNVRLDAVERSLVVPVIPPIWHDKITYRIRGAGKRCVVALNPGVRLTLESAGAQASSWVLDASWAQESDVRIEAATKLFIGGIQVAFTGAGRHETLLRLRNNLVFQFVPGEHELALVEQDVPPGMDRQALQEHLRTLAREHRLVMPYTPVRGYPIPFEKPGEPRTTTAWYDASEERFLYIRNEDVLEAEDTLLGAVAGGYAWFYEPENFLIWQVDAVTGLLSHRYRLLVNTGEAAGTMRITRIEADAQGVIHVVQEIARATRASDVLVYVIHEGQLLLSSITRDRDDALESVLSARDTLADWSQVLGSHYAFKPDSGDEAFVTVDWQPAPFVSVCWKIKSHWRDMAWVRHGDRLIIRPSTSPGHAYRGWNDSIKNMTDMTLLTLADDGDVFVIYHKLTQQLCRKQCTWVAGKAQWAETWMHVDKLEHVVAVDGGYVALTSDGVFFNLTRQGNVELGGVSDLWLKDRPQWWLALAPLARQYATERLAIVGLSNFSGDAKLCAWYVAGRLLLADLGHGKEVRLLGVTPDSEAAWLFEVASGEVYRQAFIDPQALAAAFAQGSRLLLADALPVAAREWAPYPFAELTIEGTGLRGVTRDGVVMRLRDRQPAVICGVTQAWGAAQAGREYEHLKQLTDSEPHAGLLSIEAADSLRWLVVETGRVIRVPRAAMPESFEVLGTRQRSNVLLHEDKDRRLLTYPDRASAGPLDYVRRDGEVLVVEGQVKVDDVLPLVPDDVTTLVLRMGQGAAAYRLSRALWLRLESVVLDSRHWLDGPAQAPASLIWELDEPDRLMLSIVGEHLVIIDPDSGHSVIFRQGNAADVNVRGNIRLGFGGAQTHAVSTLVQLLLARQDAQGSATLKALASVSRAVENNRVD
ncbi:MULTISPECIES: TcdA/TcdB pore-forming domain-containing protein [Pseudomonas]|uniref:TcdA/TcdB pore-forming domain-containing protein n=1 Tax=Pseudomonas TaxID=286 RepID=UPI001BE816D3|nr:MULTISPECIES: TcdA/TcdB pore-forming domain-containing protein [Pseudomonas]MBT2339263.1 toxin [Pseudomonas fluorescens]MCD4528934.1 YopT-type cysteine protease domain-containing protein [Pseudomonas sp. C3-2018]